ncbi:hypothetical protein YC2023_032121 [Brassica napus]
MPFDLIHIDILGPFSVETIEQKVSPSMCSLQKRGEAVFRVPSNLFIYLLGRMKIKHRYRSIHSPDVEGDKDKSEELKRVKGRDITSFVHPPHHSISYTY